MYLFTLFYIQTFLSATLGLLCLYKASVRSKEVKLAGMLFVLSFIFNLFQLIIYKLGISFALSNMIGSVYDILFLILAGIIYNHVTGSRYKTAFTLLTIIFLVGATLNLAFIQKSDIASWNKFFISIIVMAYCVVYFYRLMKDLPAVHLQRVPMFWINSAFLIYAAGTVFLFAFTSYVIRVLNEKFVDYWGLNLILFIIQQLIIVVGVLYELKVQIRPGDSKTFS